jgi:hypothetical protein
MTGWRLGWAVCPPWFVPHLLNVVTHNTSCANSVSQRAALAALRQPDEVVESMAREFGSRCRTAYEALSAVEGVTISPPRGSFYLFPKIAAIQGPSRQFCPGPLGKGTGGGGAGRVLRPFGPGLRAFGLHRGRALLKPSLWSGCALHQGLCSLKV